MKYNFLVLAAILYDVKLFGGSLNYPEQGGKTFESLHPDKGILYINTCKMYRLSHFNDPYKSSNTELLMSIIISF